MCARVARGGKVKLTGQFESRVVVLSHTLLLFLSLLSISNLQTSVMRSVH